MACEPCTSKKIDGFDKWEVEEAARTLMRAVEIRGKPKLLALAQKEATKQAKLAQEAAMEKKVQAKLTQTFRNPNHSGYGSRGRKKE